MSRIIVCGYMVRHPVPGNVYAFLQYVVGLHRLGHDVAYVEERGWDSSCYDVAAGAYGDDPTVGLGVVRDTLRRHSARGVPVAYVDDLARRTRGASREDVAAAICDADVVLNIGGVCWLPEMARARRLALVDMDPLFTQAGKFASGVLERHHVFFTYGLNIGRPSCRVPTLGIPWIATVPPVMESSWRLGPPADDAPFTTVANWDAYGTVVIDGTEYGPKGREFLRLGDVPIRAGAPVEVSLAGAPDDASAALRAGGWTTRDAASLIDVTAYRRYIGRSAGEFTPAKHGYVASGSGWFSDRSVCYLASGRPVVAQDTGFTEHLPVGDGLLPFSSPEDAVDALRAVRSNLAHHSACARAIARDHFSYRVVLPKILADVGAEA